METKRTWNVLFMALRDGLGAVVASIGTEALLYQFFAGSYLAITIPYFLIPLALGMAGFVLFQKNHPTAKDNWKYVGMWLLMMWMFRWLGLIPG